MLRKVLCVLAALAVVALAAPAWAVPAFPWRLYEMDEGTGTTINPERGRGVSGTVAGGVLSWQTGWSGQAGDYSLKQEGGGYISLVETYALPGPYSISVWVKHDPSSGGNETVFGADGSTGLLLKDDVGGDYKWTHNSSWDAYAAAGVLDDGDWHNVVLTYNPTGAVQHFYIDGVDTDTWLDEWVGGMGSTESRMTLFYSFYGSSSAWGGYDGTMDARLDDFAVWKVALTADDALWLSQHSASEIVPEPAALSLLGLGVLALRRRRS